MSISGRSDLFPGEVTSHSSVGRSDNHDAATSLALIHRIHAKVPEILPINGRVRTVFPTADDVHTPLCPLPC